MASHTSAQIGLSSLNLNSSLVISWEHILQACECLSNISYTSNFHSNDIVNMIADLDCSNNVFSDLMLHFMS